MMGTVTGGGAATPLKPKVHTEHEAANEAIEGLRDAAATLKRVGDELHHTHIDRERLQGEVERLVEQLAEAEAQAAEGGEALAAVDDFRLGLCDRDELLKRVCGRT